MWFKKKRKNVLVEEPILGNVTLSEENYKDDDLFDEIYNIIKEAEIDFKTENNKFFYGVVNKKLYIIIGSFMSINAIKYDDDGKTIQYLTEIFLNNENIKTLMKLVNEKLKTWRKKNGEKFEERRKLDLKNILNS